MANYIYNRSAAKWQSMYSTYVSKYWQAAGGVSSAFARNLQPLSLEQFKANYQVARNTNIGNTGRAGNVYKTLIERDRTSPFSLTKEQAKVLQKFYKDKGVKKTQRELMLTGGDTLSDYNKYLKQRYPEKSGTQRAKEIGEIFFGS